MFIELIILFNDGNNLRETATKIVKIAIKLSSLFKSDNIIIEKIDIAIIVNVSKYIFGSFNTK